MKEYAERYKHLSSIELMKIIEDAHAYQPEAVDAARFVIDSRALSESDLDLIKHSLEEERIKEQALIQRKQDLQHKVIQVASSFLDKIDPSERNASYIEKVINLISILYGTYVFYFLVMNAWMIKSILNINNASFDLEMVEPLSPLIILAVALVLFYLKKRAGWILLVCYFLYSISTLIIKFLLHLFGDSSLFESYSRFQPLRLLTIILYAITLWFLYKADLRKDFRIDLNTTVFVTMVMLSFIAFNMYWHYGT